MCYRFPFCTARDKYLMPFPLDEPLTKRSTLWSAAPRRRFHSLSFLAFNKEKTNKAASGRRTPKG